MIVEFLIEIFLGIILVLTGLILWTYRQRNIFNNVDFPVLRTNSLFGAFSDVFTGKQGFYENVLSLYNRKEVKDAPFFGVFLFHKPALVVNDPELIKKILISDFDKFPNRYAASDVHDPVGHYNIFSAKSPLSKYLRSKLSPFFSSVKLKTMYYLLDKISSDLAEHVHKRLDKDGRVELELKELSALYSTDVIASCAFGVEANSLVNPEGEFRKAGAAMTNITLWRGFELSAFFMLPQCMRLFGFTFFSKALNELIQKVIPTVIAERKKTGNRRNDLIDTLIEIKNSDARMTDDIILAQAGGLFVAGNKK